MVIDVPGDISLILSVVTLFLLVLGLPLVRSSNLKSPDNFKRHGYLTVVALLIETILVIVVMLPTVFSEFGSILALAPMYAINTWLHIVLGGAAEVAGFFFVVVWLRSIPLQLRCARYGKMMAVTFVFWLVVVFSGAVIHLIETF